MDYIHGINIGSQFLSTTGRTWTLRAVTPNGARLVLASPGPDGECGAVMDIAAVRRMVLVDYRDPGSAADEYSATSLHELTTA